MNATAPDTARSSVPLACAWLVVALVLGPVGLLLVGLSGASSGDGRLGLVLLAASLLAGATGAAGLATGRVARAWSLGLSAAHVVLGVVAVGDGLSGATVFLEDVLVVGLPPLVGGVVTGLLALRR